MPVGSSTATDAVYKPTSSLALFSQPPRTLFPILLRAWISPSSKSSPPSSTPSPLLLTTQRFLNAPSASQNSKTKSCAASCPVANTPFTSTASTPGFTLTPIAHFAELRFNLIFRFICPKLRRRPRLRWTDNHLFRRLKLNQCVPRILRCRAFYRRSGVGESQLSCWVYLWRFRFKSNGTIEEDLEHTATEFKSHYCIWDSGWDRNPTDSSSEIESGNWIGALIFALIGANILWNVAAVCIYVAFNYGVLLPKAQLILCLPFFWPYLHCFCCSSS